MQDTINTIVCVALMLITVLVSCSEDKDTLSKAVLASADALTFEANDASEKIITVYADAEWVSEVPEWVTVSPATGKGTMDVTVSVTDNMRGGAIDNPRKATLVFKGGTLASRAEVIVSQNGDKYRDCKEYQLSEISSLADETVLSIKEATVMAVATNGFIVSDAGNGANVYMQSTASVSVGDRVSVKGTKESDSYALSYVACDETTTLSTGASVTYPQPTDITSNVDSYTSTERTFIAADGILSGNNVTIDGMSYSVMLTDASDALNLSALNGHKVRVMGYYAGTAAPVVRLMPVAVEDNGVVEVVYFSDDFEWMNSWAEASGAGRTVENDDASATAPNIFTAAALKSGFQNDLETVHGYTLVYRNAKSNAADAVYLQKNYLKFGKTSFEAGIVLPPVDGIPAGEKLTLSFDWCPMITGSHKYDNVELAVLLTNGADETELATLSHSFDNADAMKWLHAEVEISGMTVDKNSKITIRSKAWDAASGSQRRWFLDNVKLKKAE